MSNIIMLKDADFDGVIAAQNAPYVIEFFATWCSHCQAMAPVLEQLADDFEGKIKIFTVDIDVSPQMTDAYQISSMPTIILAKTKNDTQKLVGEQGYQSLKADIAELLK